MRGLLDDPRGFSSLFRLYRAYKNGYLPDEGGYTSQSDSLMILFDVIDQTIGEADAARDKAAKDAAKLRELQGNG